MLQDIGQGLFRNEYMPVPPQKEDIVFSFDGGKTLLREGEEGIEVPLVGSLKEAELPHVQYLFRIGERSYYLWMGKEPLQKARFSYEIVRKFRLACPQALCFAGETAYHLYRWYRDNRFCGVCGHEMVHDTVERAMRCPSCEHVVYPKIMPAVIVGVIHEGKLLTSRYAGRAYGGLALIAGFVEIGETGEDTVRREVMEEVGLKVKNIIYFATQPWGFESDLLLGYFCEVDGDPTIHVDHRELATAEWMDAEMLQKEELQTITLTATMMDTFRKGLYPPKNKLFRQGKE